MHEASVTQALVEQVREALPPAGVLQQVRIEVGELEHLDAEVMRVMWSAFIEGTELVGAGLSVSPVPLRVRCGSCGREYAPEDPAILVCPFCAAARPEVLAGRGIVLRSLEVDLPEEE
jgi:hydrogenase nickel incorporation protein HypA/HybF